MSTPSSKVKPEHENLGNSSKHEGVDRLIPIVYDMKANILDFQAVFIYKIIDSDFDFSYAEMILEEAKKRDPKIIDDPEIQNVCAELAAIALEEFEDAKRAYGILRLFGDKKVRFEDWLRYQISYLRAFKETP